MIRGRSGRAVVAATAMIAAVATACTSSKNGTPTLLSPQPTSAVAGPASTTPPSTSAVPATSAAPKPVSSKSSTTPPPTAPPSTSAATTAAATSGTASAQPPAPALSATSATSAPPPTTGLPACSAGQLTATAVRGGAYQGQEIAGVVFTNSSHAACSVRGYPFAQLRYRGQPLGNPAAADPAAVRTVVLRPGRAAQAQLSARTTCQAPISDHLRVRVPATDTPQTVPMQLRGCSLRIGPLEAG